MDTFVYIILQLYVYFMSRGLRLVCTHVKRKQSTKRTFGEGFRFRYSETHHRRTEYSWSGEFDICSTPTAHRKGKNSIEFYFPINPQTIRSWQRGRDVGKHVGSARVVPFFSFNSFNLCGMCNPRFAIER